MFNLNKEAVNGNIIYHNKSNSTLIKFNEEITDNFMTVIFNIEYSQVSGMSGMSGTSCCYLVRRRDGSEAGQSHRTSRVCAGAGGEIEDLLARVNSELSLTVRLKRGRGWGRSV